MATSNQTLPHPDRLDTPDGTLTYEDHGGDGPLLILLPGAGDVRSEHRFLAAQLAATGFRVVAADLRGHGDTTPAWPSYGVAETAGDIAALIRHLDAGPATLIANSFAPAASLWLAADHPDLVRGVVAISAHLEQDAGMLRRLALGIVVRGPWASALWVKLYRGWYKSSPPADLDEQLSRLRTMMRDRRRRAAVRATLLASREGLEDRLGHVRVPVLAIFGDADDHFADPAAAAADVASRTNGEFITVPGAGHYPHVEQPGPVATAVVAYLQRI